jgi:hypothetical protein
LLSKWKDDGSEQHSKRNLVSNFSGYLHQLWLLVAKNCWLFGEEFGLSFPDRSLSQALQDHRGLLSDGVCIDEPEKFESQSGLNCDALFSRVTRCQNETHATHLVVELKARGAKINFTEVGQIEVFAASVFNDVRYRVSGARWVYWLIGDELGSFAKFRRMDETGLFMKNDQVSIYVKSWQQLLTESRGRLKFIEDGIGEA